MKRTYLSAAVTLMAATALSITVSDANAQMLKSTYTNTASCATVEEGEDRFTLKCTAPGSNNLHAILSYWDGQAFVAIEPFYQPGQKARLRTIANDASRVFGQKIEWRLRDGKPCAAIVRVHSTKAGILAVSDLATGNHLGDAATNAQAHKLADKACLSDAKANFSNTSTKTDVSPVNKAAATSGRQESVVQTARRGQKTFDDVYRMGGISSAIDDIKACYGKLKHKVSRTGSAGVAGLAQCAAIDILGGNVDVMMAQDNPKLMQKYFDRGRATDKRIADRMKRLGLNKQQRAAFQKELAGALGATLQD